MSAPAPSRQPAPSTDAAPRLALQGVGKRYGAHTALQDVTFDLHESEMVAVLGPSGAGKTTLMRCVSGLVEPDTGTVRVAGRDVRTLRGQQRSRIAVVFQQFNLVSRISAFDNVIAGRLGRVAAWRGITRRFEPHDRKFALECLERVGMLQQACQRADTLSGGQQQRVAIARALAQQPDLIVADEPVASLDPANASSILELLRTICRDDGVSVLCSLHQVHYARQYVDRVIGLAHGRVVLAIPAGELDERRAGSLYQA